MTVWAWLRPCGFDGYRQGWILISPRKCCGGCALIILMWISALVGIPGNKMVDGIARDDAKNELYYSSVAPGGGFYRQIKLRILSEWQDRWNQWSGMPFQFVLVCNSTPDSMDWGWMIQSLWWCLKWC
jgi:hypothetical protein